MKKHELKSQVKWIISRILVLELSFAFISALVAMISIPGETYFETFCDVFIKFNIIIGGFVIGFGALILVCALILQWGES